jgi:RNA polymerase sigma-70 factor (ECF subfamily)
MTREPYDDPRQAFEGLTLPHLDALYRFAASRVRNRHEAEDAVQEVCLKAYRALDQFEPGTDYRAWLFRILANTLSDRYRKGGRSAPTVPLDAAHDGSEAGPALEAFATIADPEREFLARSQALAVQRAVEELPTEWQTIVRLSVVDGFSYKQIAAILECPIGTVMSRLYRSRRVLADRLATLVGADTPTGSAAGRPPGGVTPLARIRERLGGQLKKRGGAAS